MNEHILKAREVMWLTKHQIWNIPEGVYKVEFDDGIVPMTNRQIILSWYYWELYRVFNVKCNSFKGAIHSYYTASSHRDLGKMIWLIYDQMKNPNPNVVWDMSEVFYDIHAQIYNITCDELSEYVTTGSLHDFMDILKHPLVQKSKEEYRKTIAIEGVSEMMISEAILNCYKATDEVLYKNPELMADNGIKKLCLSGLVSKGQMRQMIGPRGMVHDVTGKVFKFPIDTGYVEGMNTIYDSAVESRSASRAALMNQVPLQESEYFNRGIQMAAAVTSDWEYIEGGCTGYATVGWLVEEYDTWLLKGKYHMVGNVPTLLTGDIKDHVGKIIQLRSIMGCGHPDAQKVCQICLGWSSRIIPPGSNVGYTLGIPTNSKVSQDMLSTKHLDGSSSTKVLELDRTALKWFQYRNKKTNELYLTDAACKQTIIIRIETAFVKHLPQILHASIDDLNPATISTIPELGISFVDNEGLVLGMPDMIHLSVAGTGVHLTKQVLKHLKQKKWGSSKGYIEIKLTNWNPAHPIFLIPQKGDDVWTFFNALRRFILAEGKNGSKITDYKTTSAALSELVSILRERFKPGQREFNIVQCEAILRGLMVIDQHQDKYDLPRPNDTFQFMGLKKVLSVRSLSAMLLWQGQFDSMLKPHWQDKTKTTEYFLDDLFLLK
jgi:hypothetical protein